MVTLPLETRPEPKVIVAPVMDTSPKGLLLLSKFKTVILPELEDTVRAAPATLGVRVLFNVTSPPVAENVEPLAGIVKGTSIKILEVKYKEPIVKLEGVP